MGKPLLYDDSQAAKKIYENGFTVEMNDREVSLLAKHLRKNMGYGKAKIKRFLIDFCEKNVPFFNYKTSRHSILSAVNKCDGRFIVRTGMNITKAELDKIRTIRNFSAQKFYLGMLTFSKRDNSKKVNLSDWPSIKQAVGLNMTNDRVSREIIHLLYANGFIVPRKA